MKTLKVTSKLIKLIQQFLVLKTCFGLTLRNAFLQKLGYSLYYILSIFVFCKNPYSTYTFFIKLLYKEELNFTREFK